MAPSIDAVFRVVARQVGDERGFAHTARTRNPNDFGRKASKGVIDAPFERSEVLHKHGMRKFAGLNVSAQLLSWRHSSFSPVFLFTMCIKGALSYEMASG
ncbi:Uncharacterised protein [Burkholderia pseudomallei]|nr:Uncharacterised protein [Burkholderia pseudomallei]VBE72558.1 Uncharacterised protein [Burkholderia pseudomallei]